MGQDDYGFVKCAQPKTAPALTDQEGVFVAGTAAGPKDIVDTIAKAGSAAMEAANYMRLMESASNTSTAVVDQIESAAG